MTSTSAQPSRLEVLSRLGDAQEVAPPAPEVDAALDFETAALLAAIVGSSQDAIIGKTLDGVITSWNPGAELMYGYPADEIIGHNIAELIPANRARELEPILARITRGKSVQPFETQRVAKGGRILDVSVVVTPIRDVHGVVTGASTVARDITDITRAKAELRSRDIEDAHRSPVHDLHVVFPNGDGEHRPNHHGLGAELTQREVEVLELMAGGLLNKQVARALGLQLNTVRNHSQSILGKLEAHSRLEAVTTAVRDGIIDYPAQAIAI